MGCRLLSSVADQMYWHQPCPCFIVIVSSRTVTQKGQPEVARYHGVSGVLGVIKRRLGAKFDDAGRCGSWAAEIVESALQSH